MEKKPYEEPAMKQLTPEEARERIPAAEAVPPSENGPKKKKPYIKPAYRMEKVFVTTALSCGKISPTQYGCAFGYGNTQAS